MSSDAAKEEIVNKFNLLTDEHTRLSAKLAKVESSIKEVSKQISDCHAAARLFGFELSTDAEGIPTNDGSTDAKRPLIRTFVIQCLKTHYEIGGLGVRAKEIQKTYEEEYKTTLHYKTVGMTLYRLKEEGLARREGRDWFLADGADLIV